MINIQYKNKLFPTPTEWNELNRKQLLTVAKLLHTPTESYKAKLLLLKAITGMSFWTFFRINSEEFAGIIDLVDFLIEDNTLTEQLIPKYRGCYGPDSELMNLKMKEFVYAEMYLNRYLNEKEDEFLDGLIAVLYRQGKRHYDKKKNPEGDVRRDFNPNLIEHDISKIKFWPRKVKEAIKLWYMGCRKMWTKRYDEVFGGGGSGGDGSNYGMYSILREVAKDGVFGTFDDVENQYVNTILMHLQESVREARALEKQTKQ